MSSRFPLRSGRRIRPERWLVAGLLLLAACNYGFQGGGGFPSDVRTLYIEPFENDTGDAELESQVFSKILERLPRALGVRPGARETADAILTGRITRYSDVTQDIPADPTNIQNEVQIGISVRIVDVRENLILWESSSLVGRAVYRPSAPGETDRAARERAIEHLIQQIVDGAQSQW